MRRLVLTLTLAAAAAGLLASCGGSDDKPIAVKGKGYTYTAPAGWQDLTGDTDKIAKALGAAGADVTAEDIGASYDTIVVAADETDGFRTNFNVTLQSGIPPQLDAKKVATQSAAILANPSQASQFLPDGFDINYDGAPPEKTTLGGEDAYKITYAASVKGKDLKASQTYVVHDGTAYVATFTASGKAFDDQQPDLDSMLKSWKFD